MKKNLVVLSAALVLVTSSLHAADECECEEKEEKKESPWTTTTGLGYVNTSGNTNTETLIFRFDTAYEIEKWKHAASFETLKASTEDVTTADRKLFTAQSNYKFRPRDYFYGNVSYEDDKFSGFEYQAKLSLGYGRKIILTERHELDGEIGPGYRNFKVDNAPSSEDEALLRLAGLYKWKISSYSEFNQDLIGDFGEDQTEWRSVTGLRTSIYESLALRLAYTVRYLDVVPVGNENYDRTTSITLDYTF
jgi:putative salt-induced outer membrane protein